MARHRVMAGLSPYSGRLQAVFDIVALPFVRAFSRSWLLLRRAANSAATESVIFWTLTRYRFATVSSRSAPSRE